MTSREIFNQTVSLMAGEPQDREDYAPFWNDVINLLLAETYALNNALRAQADKPPLKEIPVLQTMDEELPYEPALARIMPLGGAGYLYMEDDPQIASYYSAKFQSLKEASTAAKYVKALWV